MHKINNNNNKPKASSLLGTSHMEHTSNLIAHIHTQENTQKRVKKKKFQSPATSNFPKYA